MAMITSQDKTSVNSRPPPISKPQGIRTVGLNSPHIFLLFVPVIPTVIPLFFDASIAALLVAGIFYYVFNIIVAFVMEYLEKRLDYYE